MYIGVKGEDLYIKMHQLKQIKMTIEPYNPSILKQTSWKGIKLNGALNLCVKKVTEKNVSPSKRYCSSKLICRCHRLKTHCQSQNKV